MLIGLRCAGDVGQATFGTGATSALVQGHGKEEVVSERFTIFSIEGIATSPIIHSICIDMPSTP